ncbi:phosphate ABC transporter, permease protein PstA [Aliifodinibius salipaludis]|uniref:Phosphate transport system permease protein PstA n=1 Tax=Fodinibius salipaludis TaxID=2032627 RepID=A0A2A2GF31_9BACT|nr:phosphate ABC transporter permease PstA [Aliifodinibius salipaludis]PAU95604.1 phosphate ABC transporter, permease protein PstA [Aliifodinibius salipaludis]
MNRAKINRLKDKAFKYFGIFASVIGIVILAIFIGFVIYMGIQRLSWDFMVELPSRFAENSGIYTAWMGTVWIMVFTTLISFPLGVGAGIYLEEYGKKNRWSSFLEINISNLASVPSIIYGLLGLGVFVRMMQMGNSILAGALTLSLLILPIIIVSTREAIKAVPSSIRDASNALGASKWQTIWHQVLPASFGGILTGVILALSRAIGETAPLIVVGALVYVPFAPQSPLDEFTVLPVQIYNWVSRPQEEFVINAAAAIIVLLGITFIMNGIAVYFRNKWQNKMQW